MTAKQRTTSRARAFYAAFFVCIVALVSSNVASLFAQDRQAMVRLLGGTGDYASGRLGRLLARRWGSLHWWFQAETDYREAFAAIERALAIAVAAWAAIITYFNAYPDGVTPPEWLRAIMRGVRELDAWCAIVACIGFAHRYLKNADGPLRQTLTQTIFPFYLIHQTLIVVAGHYLDELRMPLAIEAPLLIFATALGCWLFYDLGRRVPVLRVWIGLPSKTPRTVSTLSTPAVGEAS